MDYCYPIVPLSGEKIPRADSDGAMSLKEIVLLLNDAELQPEGLSALGFILGSNKASVTIRFKERGKAYADPDGDRTKTEEELSERFFETSFALPQKVDLPLEVCISLGGWNQDGINFLGRVEATGGYTLPLTGRGTAALEGRTGDAHAGFCTGGACAAFQERVSLLLAFCVAAGARAADLRNLVENFRPINARYHGRQAILDYTLHCALLPADSAGSYRSFIRIGNYFVHDVMKPLLDGEKAPDTPYFEKLKQKFSDEELAEAESLPSILQDAPPNQTPFFYPVQALPGNKILLSDGRQSRPLEEIAALLNDPVRQPEAIQMLGFGVTPGQTSIAFEFVERGKAYAQPCGDRCLTEDEETERQFSKRLSLMEPLAREMPALPLQVSLQPWLQESVNFLGQVTVSLPDGARVVIPLTGRGTAALEGRSGDAHAGFCTGGACAAFQNRVALSLAVARSFGVHDDHLVSLAEKFREINSCYHGRGDILDYTLSCALGRDSKTYVGFMKQRYPSHIGRPPVLTSVLTTGRPPPIYFVKLAQKFSPEEMEAERQRHVVKVEESPAKVAINAIYLEEEKKKEKKSEQRLTTAAIVVSACIGAVCIILFFSLRK